MVMTVGLAKVCGAVREGWWANGIEPIVEGADISISTLKELLADSKAYIEEVKKEISSYELIK